MSSSAHWIKLIALAGILLLNFLESRGVEGFAVFPLATVQS